MMIPPFWVDVLVFLLVALVAYSATRQGFLAVLLSLMRFFLALGVAFVFAAPVSDFVTDLTGWSPVWTRPGAFLGLWLIVDLLLGRIMTGLLTRVHFRVHQSPVNRVLAVLPGILQGLVVASVLLMFVTLLPMAEPVRRGIARSPLSSQLVETAFAAAQPIAEVFDDAVREARGFITIRPPTTPGETDAESIRLPFTVENARSDPATEEAMLVLVNRERTERGLAPLAMDPELVPVARAHADDMFRRGYFSHNTPEGLDPFDRIRAANVPFIRAGENLALAPTLAMAHEGLMNSPGHRAAILHTGFGQVGIGVLDGGIHGKMFVQVFRN